MSGAPRIVHGHDGKLYLAFADSADAEFFLDSLGAARRTVHCAGGFENAIEITQPEHLKVWG